MIGLCRLRFVPMKLHTARKNALQIHTRVRAVNGLLATPACDRDAVRIARIWVFGSTVKGAKEPRDLDLLLDLYPCGRRYSAIRHEASVDREYFSRYGVRTSRSSCAAALKWIRSGMRGLSLHRLTDEKVGIDTMVEIYPRFLLDRHFAGDAVSLSRPELSENDISIIQVARVRDPIYLQPR